MSALHRLPFSIGTLQEVLLKAAAIIRKFYDLDSAEVKRIDDRPVTQADVSTNLFLRESLLRIMPKAGWLSEESKEDGNRCGREWVWIVDPLDGTQEFIRRRPEFAVSVGLIQNYRVVAAGVINPISGEGGVGSIYGETRFWGISPRFCPAETLRQAIAGVSRTEMEDGTVLPFLRLVGATRSIGSVAYKLLRVAAGAEDLTFSVQHKSEWDICGGIGLLYAMGKVYRRFDGKPVLFNQEDTRIRCGAAAGSEHLIAPFIRKYERKNSFFKKGTL